MWHSHSWLCSSAVIYRRNLPHWHPQGKALFVTWRLHGSLPRAVPAPRKPEQKISGGKRFVVEDHVLDKAETGPLWLKHPQIAQSVVDTFRKGDLELGQYELYAFVVMANHVHVLLRPQVPLRRIMNGIKGVTAQAANRILGRTGQPFWQDESFDHWVRSEAEFQRIWSYIERNPGTAGLVKRPEDWPWSSASGSHAAQAGVPVPLGTYRGLFVSLAMARSGTM